MQETASGSRPWWGHHKGIRTEPCRPSSAEPGRVRQIEVGTLGLSGNETSFLGLFSTAEPCSHLLNKGSTTIGTRVVGLFNKTLGWRLTQLPALHKRIPFPGRTGSLISYSTSSQPPPHSHFLKGLAWAWRIMFPPSVSSDPSTYFFPKGIWGESLSRLPSLRNQGEEGLELRSGCFWRVRPFVSLPPIISFEFLEI